MNAEPDGTVTHPVRERGFLVWCLIAFGAWGFLSSLWSIAFGIEIPTNVSPELARSLLEGSEWLLVTSAIVGGLLSFLMALYFFRMSRNVFIVVYAMLISTVVFLVLRLILNPALRAFISATGLWPILIPLIFNIAIVWYAHYLDENNRLEA